MCDSRVDIMERHFLASYMSEEDREPEKRNATGNTSDLVFWLISMDKI